MQNEQYRIISRQGILSVWNEEKGLWFFSVADIVAALTERK